MMQAKIARSQYTARPLKAEIKVLEPWPTLHCWQAGSAERRLRETYIADIFQRYYGASLEHFLPLLFSLERQGQPIAALGLNYAVNNTLFSEAYLDEPAEVYIPRLFAQPCSRQQIMELGNLAASEPRQSAHIYLLLIAAMQQAGIRYLIFTANRLVQASIKRCGFTPKTIGPALQHRLGANAESWGSYYEGSPVVMVADIRLTMTQAHAKSAMCAQLTQQQNSIAAIADVIRDHTP